METAQDRVIEKPRAEPRTIHARKDVVDSYPDNTGLFITFEGPEGAGKSTQISRLSERMRHEGYDVLTTKEPGGTEFADAARSILLAGTGRPDVRAELLLVLAARVDHVVKVIEPALASGRVVICDRFMDSTFAYQGAGGRIESGTIEVMNDFATAGRVPHLTFLMSLPPEEGLARICHAGRDRFESEDLEFHRRVMSCFLARAEQEPERIQVIDGSLEPDMITTQLYARLKASFPEFAGAE